MGAIPKSLLVAVAAILGLCALAGFAMGLTSTFAHRVSAANDEEAPIAGNVAPGVTIKDAQPLAPPPPPPPPPKPKAAVADAAASDQPPSDAPPAKAPAAPPTESAPGAPPSLVLPPLPKAPLPADLPPV